jgi:hypothetical protein
MNVARASRPIRQLATTGFANTAGISTFAASDGQIVPPCGERGIACPRRAQKAQERDLRYVRATGGVPLTTARRGRIRPE